MYELLTMIGSCFIAIVLSIVALKKAKKGNGYKKYLIIGIVIYAMALIGNSFATQSAMDMIPYVISLILLISMFFVCKSQK